MNPYNVYRTYSEKNEYLDIMNRLTLSSFLPQAAEKYIKSADYQQYNGNDIIKKEKLNNFLKKKITESKENIVDFMEGYTKSIEDKNTSAEEVFEKDIEFLYYLRGELKEKISYKDIESINFELKKEKGEKFDIMEAYKAAKSTNNPAAEGGVIASIFFYKDQIKKLNKEVNEKYSLFPKK